MSELPKQYEPSDYEQKMYEQWEQAGAFELADGAEGEPYVIVLPPPNITGVLHMGHALQDTIMDVLIRYHRAAGRPTVWIPGTDSAAIATNRVMLKQLEEEGMQREDISREEFLERTEQWYAATGGQIVNQMKRLGCSCDWERSRFTLDDDYITAVQTCFVRYFEKGYIYRGARLVNWDPATQTTVSDLEIDWQTEKTPFYTLQYGPFQIGTARPETKFGDKYVVMHPEDERYQQYAHGDTFECEWINGTVTATVIKDDAIDPTFGTGVMTITPWHDATDFEIAERHNLTYEQIIDFNGTLLPVAGDMAGQTIAEARASVVSRLEEKGLVVSIDESYEHNSARNDRGKGLIEPQVMRQWFVNMEALKQAAITAAENEDVSFVPPRWKKHFLNWLDGMHDWNINRQIWLGHRLPVWWKPGTHGTDQEEGNYVVSLEKPAGEEDGPPAEGWEQDPDVLDTWFATALWPFAVLGWPKNTPDLEQLYPTSVLVTARDILYLWVARMVFSGLELMDGEDFGDRAPKDRVPFKEVFIHPVVLTKDGQRMSKSLGTGVDPLELIESYGADATRFGLLYQMNYDNQALKFDEAALVTARNFGNKLWNIARLLDSLPERDERSVADDWIEGRLADVAKSVHDHITTHHIGEAARELYDFVWSDFADWYMEIVKVSGSTTVAHATFNHILQVLHPFMPHLTEVLWQHRGGDGLLITAPWPTLAVPARDTVREMEHFQDVVTTIRQVRALLQLPPKEVLAAVVTDIVLPDALAKVASVELVGESSETVLEFPLAHGGSIKLASEHFTPDRIAAAHSKVTQAIHDLEALLQRQEKQLSGMRGKAPDEIITEVESQQADAKERLKGQHDLLTSLAA